VREKYWWLVADKPGERGNHSSVSKKNVCFEIHVLSGPDHKSFCIVQYYCSLSSVSCMYAVLL
jgi:hypothetical protein